MGDDNTGASHEPPEEPQRHIFTEHRHSRRRRLRHPSQRRGVHIHRYSNGPSAKHHLGLRQQENRTLHSNYSLVRQRCSSCRRQIECCGACGMFVVCDTAVFFQVISTGWCRSFRGEVTLAPSMNSASRPESGRSTPPCTSVNTGKQSSSQATSITGNY